MRHHGATRIYAKNLAPNDNSKNQVYLGGDFSALNIIPHGEIYSDDTAVAGAVRDRAKAKVNFFWVDEAGRHHAPDAGLILYPKYPEVRMGERILRIVAHQMPIVLFDHGDACIGKLSDRKNWQACAHKVGNHAMAQRVCRSRRMEVCTGYRILDGTFPFIFRPWQTVSTLEHLVARRLALALFGKEVCDGFRNSYLSRNAILVSADCESSGSGVEVADFHRRKGARTQWQKTKTANEGLYIFRKCSQQLLALGTIQVDFTTSVGTLDGFQSLLPCSGGIGSSRRQDTSQRRAKWDHVAVYCGGSPLLETRFTQLASADQCRCFLQPFSPCLQLMLSQLVQFNSGNRVIINMPAKDAFGD